MSVSTNTPETADRSGVRASFELSSELTLLDDRLATLNAAVAKEFLGLAASLQSIASHAGDMTGLSRSAAALASAGESNQAFGMLENIVGEAEQAQQLAEINQHKLRNILASLQQSGVPVARLETLSVLLTTIGTLSRIEGGRVRTTVVDLCNLAADITGLAREVDANVNKIAHDAIRLTTLVGDGLTRLEGVAGQERQQASELINGTRAVLQSMHARDKASRAATIHIDARYAKIRSAIEKLVVSLQAQDIARQRVEHVQDAFQQLAMAIDRGDHSECAAIMALQYSHLVSTRDYLARSMGEVFENLRDVSSQMVELAAETANLSTQADSDGCSVASGIDEGLRAIPAIMDRYCGSARATDLIVNAVVPFVAAMTHVAGELRHIQSTIRRTALNARIETSRLGSEGVAMRALASELQDVAEAANRETGNLLENLASVETNLALVSQNNVARGSSAMMSSSGGAR